MRFSAIRKYPVRRGNLARAVCFRLCAPKAFNLAAKVRLEMRRESIPGQLSSQALRGHRTDRLRTIRNEAALDRLYPDPTLMLINDIGLIRGLRAVDRELTSREYSLHW